MVFFAESNPSSSMETKKENVALCFSTANPLAELLMEQHQFETAGYWIRRSLEMQTLLTPLETKPTELVLRLAICRAHMGELNDPQVLYR